MFSSLIKVCSLVAASILFAAPCSQAQTSVHRDVQHHVATAVNGLPSAPAAAPAMDLGFESMKGTLSHTHGAAALMQALSCPDECEAEFETCIEETGKPPSPSPAECKQAYRACLKSCN
jgi:hypothetical protein